MSAKSPEGTAIFKDSNIYMPQATSYCDERMVFGAHRKAGYIRDTSLQPFETTEETLDIKIPESVRAIDVMMELSYHVAPGPQNIIPIHRVSSRVSLDK